MKLMIMLVEVNNVMKKTVFLSLIILISCSKGEAETEDNNTIEKPTIMELLDRQKYVVERYETTSSNSQRVSYDVDISEGNQNNFYFSNDAFVKYIYDRILVYESQNCETAIVGPGCDNNKNLNAYCVASAGNILSSTIDDYGDYIDIRNRDFIWIISLEDEKANRIRIDWHGRNLYRNGEKPGQDFSMWSFFAVNENSLLNRSSKQSVDYFCNSEIFTW